MRIRAERDDLTDVFSRATRAVGPRAALPILQGVLCEVGGTTLRVTGTDLEMTVRTMTEVEVMSEGSTVIPARLAEGAISKMPEGAVTLSSQDGEIEIQGAGPTFRIRALPVDEYPQLSEPEFGEATTMDGDVLASAVAQVAVAASSDSARPILTGVLVEASDLGTRLVATDSYRLAVREIAGVEVSNQGLIPARGMRELGRTIGAEKVRIGMGMREAAFGSERGTLTLRLIEGSFPNYRQLLPESYPNRVIVHKGALLDALARASLVAEEHIPVRLKLQDGGVELTVTRQDVGGEAEHLPGEYQGEDAEVDIAFNPRYLADGVSAIEQDKIEIQVLDSLKPSVIRGVGSDDYLYLLMPVRV